MLPIDTSILSVRVELFGNGDSDGYKCGKYGFNDIIDLYDAAMHHVVASGKKLILFGYSIGALMVPSLVNRNRESVLSAIVFDTMIFGPKDYFVKNKIRQDILRGIPKDKIMYNAQSRRSSDLRGIQIKKYHAGDSLDITVVRNEKYISHNCILYEYPRESSRSE